MKVMLAGKSPKDLATLRYPVLVSPKFDGIRAFVKDGVVYSRNNKPIPNGYVQELFSSHNGLDGELIVGDPGAEDVFRKTDSMVMSASGEGDVRFFVFDHYTFDTAPFRDRLTYAARFARQPRVVAVAHSGVKNVALLEREELQYLAQGYEGLMIRDPMGIYKHGRSTTNEGLLLKLKRFKDGDAVVMGYEEEMHNANEKGVDGKRTSHKAGKIGKGTLGALVVKDTVTGAEFSVGSGFTGEERRTLWQRRGTLKGKLVCYRYFPRGGKDAPRHPTFVGFRNDL